MSLLKESIRHLESKPQAEKLDTAVHSRKELNPAIRAELIRARSRHEQKSYLATGEGSEERIKTCCRAKHSSVYQIEGIRALKCTVAAGYCATSGCVHQSRP